MGCPSTGKFTAPVNGSYLVGFSGVAYDGQDILLHQNPYFRKYVNFLIESVGYVEEGPMHKLAGSVVPFR